MKLKLKFLLPLILAGSLTAGPINWIKHHPKVAAVMATAMVTVAVVATHQATQPGAVNAIQPAPVVKLKAITCAICTGLNN